MTVIIIAVVLVFAIIFIKSLSDKGKAPKGKCYAEVFIYDGNFRKATYLCDYSYHDKQIVVVNYKGEEYAGRILQIHYQRPEDIPRDVVFKEILRPFKDSDKTKVAYWHDGIERAIKEN